jgi:pyridinium-3,5-bisthiocarboxylic acid mononucleotide nickel chelatase
MRIGYLECFAGISGDMLLGALVDAGVPFASLEEAAAALNVGASLQIRKVMRGGLAGTKIDVITPDQPQIETTHSHHDHAPHTHEPHTHETHSHADHSHEVPTSPTPHQHSAHTHAAHRPLSKILEIIRSASLADPVKDRSIRAFQLLGEAEAAIHSIPIENVHFHEVGALDTIVDIVCSAAGAESLAIDRWLASPLNVGSGTVVCQHGTLPVPAPATLALLADAPIYAAGEPMERVTPTGAAILRMLNVHYEPLPSMRIKATGYGAGGHESQGQPNLLRLLVGEQDAAQSDQSESIAVIETVIDDCNPQVLAYVSELLLDAGAWDVYRASVQMKKGRTGVQITVLSHPNLVPRLRDILFRETTTIGLRWRLENKLALAREFLTVQTPRGEVRIKTARWPNGKISNATPEYEDCRLLASLHAVPLKQVMQDAMQAYAETERANSSGTVIKEGN